MGRPDSIIQSSILPPLHLSASFLCSCDFFLRFYTALVVLTDSYAELHRVQIGIASDLGRHDADQTIRPAVLGMLLSSR
jgi:hypothetical protein